MHVYARITVSGHDVAVTSIEARSTWVPRGQPVYISVTVENQGEVAETFDVIVYADRNSGDLHYGIGNETVSLDIGESEPSRVCWEYHRCSMRHLLDHRRSYSGRRWRPRG